MGTTERIEVAGLEVRCTHCDCDQFHARKGLISSRGLAAFGMEFWNASAHVYRCARCGHLEWFLKPDDDRRDDGAGDDIDCLSCDALIPAGQTECPECGWSYA